MVAKALAPRRGTHRIAVIEAGDGVFELSCSCGSQTWTPWGIEHAKEVARLHYVTTGTPIPANAYS